MRFITVRKCELQRAIDNYIKAKYGEYQKKVCAGLELENSKKLSRYKFWSRFFPWLKFKPIPEDVYIRMLSDTHMDDDYLFYKFALARVAKLDTLCYDSSHPHVNLTTEDAWIMSWNFKTNEQKRTI
jgi:hypothetical protein